MMVDGQHLRDGVGVSCTVVDSRRRRSPVREGHFLLLSPLGFFVGVISEAGVVIASAAGGLGNMTSVVRVHEEGLPSRISVGLEICIAFMAGEICGWKRRRRVFMVLECPLLALGLGV